MSATRPATEVFAAAFAGGACRVSGLGMGQDHEWPVAQWSATGTTEDAAVLDQCHGPTIDLGCGPGRLTEMLAARGQIALGVDVVGEAVQQTRARGVSALLRDVFSDLPAEGRWGTALLADGNIGIGGDPVGLLTRVRRLVSAGGRIVVDVGEWGVGLEIGAIEIETEHLRSEPLPWALVGADAIDDLASEAGLSALRHRSGQRWFAVLTRTELAR